ncbi:hypothetical protein LTS18_009770, partial [Coniosporium uncinatum]
MFKQAVESHQASTAANKTLSQKLFPSTSPRQQDVLDQFSKPAPHVQTRPLSNTTGNIQKTRPATLAEPPRKPTNTAHGIKRTSSGLAKALAADSGFDDDALFDLNAQDNPLLVEDDLPLDNSSGMPPKEVYFDENDFDSDIDLDVEDPAIKGS